MLESTSHFFMTGGEKLLMQEMMLFLQKIECSKLTLPTLLDPIVKFD